MKRGSIWCKRRPNWPCSTVCCAGCASAHYYIGLLYIHANDFVKAKVALSTALTHNPRLTDAERQIRAIQIRMKHADANRGAAPSESADAAKPKQKSGGFRGLFGKK